MNHDTLRQVMPVVVSIVVIIAVAVVRSYSKTLATITATMPVNIPLAMWIVYSGENGDHDTVARFAGSLFAGWARRSCSRLCCGWRHGPGQVSSRCWW